jgi:integrase
VVDRVLRGRQAAAGVLGEPEEIRGPGAPEAAHGEHALGLEIGDEAKRLTFDDLEAGFRRSYENSGRRSLRRAGKAWDHLREHFGGWKARAITAHALEDYVADRLKQAKPATVQYELAVLRRAFNLAVRAGRLQTRPPFPTLHLNNRRQGFFEEDDFRAVLAELPVHLKPLMTVGFLTGWRVRDELCPMTWDRVDLKAGTMRLEQSKNDSPRVFPINADPELAEVLQRQRKWRMMKLRTRLAVPLGFVTIVICRAAGTMAASAPRMQLAVAWAISRYQGRVCSPRSTSTGNRS